MDDIETRADNAEAALNTFVPSAYHISAYDALHPDDKHCAIIDLVTNLLHLADREGYEVDGIARMALMHHEEEVEDEKNIKDEEEESND